MYDRCRIRQHWCDERQSFDKMFSLAHLGGYNIRDEEGYITPLRGMMKNPVPILLTVSRPEEVITPLGS